MLLTDTFTQGWLSQGILGNVAVYFIVRLRQGKYSSQETWRTMMKSDQGLIIVNGCIYVATTQSAEKFEVQCPKAPMHGQRCD